MLYPSNDYRIGIDVEQNPVLANAKPIADRKIPQLFDVAGQPVFQRFDARDYSLNCMFIQMANILPRTRTYLKKVFHVARQL
jgi:hypothetical protein